MRALASRLRFGVTFAGWLLTGSVVLSGAIGALLLEIPAYHVFCWLSGAWVVALGTALVRRPRLALAAELPAKATAGDALTLRCRIENRRHAPAYHLSAGIFDAPRGVETGAGDVLTVLEAGRPGLLSLALTPLRRGVYGPLAVRVFSSFPLDLFRVGCGRVALTSLLVHPRFFPLSDVDIPAGRKFQPGGIALTSNTGESPEYIGNREYRRGDPVRRIDFKAWGRIGKPVVREYQEEYYCRVALVLDTYVPRRERVPPAGHPSLEAGVSIAAAVADVLARGEHIIDLFAAGPDLYVFRSGRQTAHFENVLEILACLEPCRDNPFARIAPALADELTRITALVFVLLDWDEARAGLVRTAEECGCSVKAILVRDGAPTSPLEEAPVPIAHYTPAQVASGAVDAL